MPELLLELLSEEIPARMQRRAIEDLAALLRDKLAAAEVPAADLRGYVTPRRLAVIADRIAATQPDHTEERRGPRVGAPQPAIDGFLRSAGISAIGECEIRDTGRGEFYFAVVKRSGRPSIEILPDLIKSAVVGLSWPKSMRWPGSSLRWVRPLSSVVCLFDSEIVPLTLDGVPVGRVTRGHRFLAPDKICVDSVQEYLEKLQRAYVVLDQDRRREIIRADLDRRAAELGVAVRADPALLDEVSGLAEFPVVLAGAIDPDFMTLPPEVLATAMRTHQKYFSCIGPNGVSAPHFLFVANNVADDGGKAIIAGNERVLKARLADARFFWDQDLRLPLAARIEALKTRAYHERLGNLFKKADRMASLAEFLSPYVGADPTRARCSAWLAKADLSTGLVGEFPELQGIIGRYCALNDGEDPRVADAIAEHYKPLGPDDTCPSAPESITVALADKVDTLISFFAIGAQPTGSRDPFALRRAALGVVRLVLENKLRCRLYPLLDYSFTQLKNTIDAKYIKDPLLTGRVLDLISERLAVYLRTKGYRYDLIRAAFLKGDRAGPDDNLFHIVARAEALARFLHTDNGASLLTAYRRAANIVRIERQQDDGEYEWPPNPKLFRQVEEQVLFESLDEASAQAELLQRNEQFAEAMVELSRLREPVDEFFEKVTVNADEPKLRENRLRLLSRIRDTMNQIADFSQIEG